MSNPFCVNLSLRCRVSLVIARKIDKVEVVDFCMPFSQLLDPLVAAAHQWRLMEGRW